MVYLTRLQNSNSMSSNQVSFGKKKVEEPQEEARDRLMYEEKKKHPVTTGLKIQADKLGKAFTTYPKKGLKGSKNANFYEFLTMGMVPYLTGSATMIAVFNLASKFFDTPAAVSASKLGKKMGLGVLFYGLGKTFSKKLIETPVNLKYDIDVNLPYDKVIHELPEDDNLGNMEVHEYHKAFESVDFPRWDLFYDNKSFGPERNSYFRKVGKKMGFDEEDLEYADQKVKQGIREKIVKTRLFSTLSSYLWAATGVGIAMQKPWEGFIINPVKRMAKGGQVAKCDNFVKDFGTRFVSSCKEFVNNSSKSTRIAGRALLGAAIGVTLLGNFATLFDFNKNRGGKVQGATSLIDDSKEKVVC